MAEEIEFLIVGAGMSGLAFANFIESDDYLVLERESEIGGWCRTVHQDGFTWDYSGHFFHFRDPEIEGYLRARMPDQEVRTVVKDSRILYGDRWIDFPFQKNIHQLEQADFIDCLHDLYFRPAPDPPSPSFKGMLYEKFGVSISEKFLVPYNEKLYACDLDALDREAMGRFFPYASLEDVIANMKRPDNASYNAAFTYPRGGAIEYVKALASEVPEDKIALADPLVAIDLPSRTATMKSGREVCFGSLVSSAPIDRLLALSALPHDPEAFSANKVLVFNLGFDGKGPESVHWVYVPETKYPFYRVGFYDNIFGTDRMSLYVEIGLPTGADVDVEGSLEEVLDGLRTAGILTDQTLVSWHSVVLDPAYAHITQASRAAVERHRAELATCGVYSIGRYGGWTYCSIEDNILEARALARCFNATR